MPNPESHPSPQLAALAALRRDLPHPPSLPARLTERYGTDATENRLYHGDNGLVMQHLLDAGFAGRFMCIYADPPFDTGVDRTMRIALQSGSRISITAYADRWDRERPYLQMLRDRLALMRELLHPAGTLYLHCDWRASAVLRLVCDDLFGPSHFMNHCIWTYKTGGTPNEDGFSRKHDDILVYAKGDRPYFDAPKQKSFVPTLPEPHTPSGAGLGVLREDGCSLCGASGPGQKYRWVRMRDVWDDIPTVFRNDPAWEGYPTQKPVMLTERIFAASSRPGDWVADFFAGSGASAVAAARLGRRWVGCEVGLPGLHTIRKRLVRENVPFAIHAVGDVSAGVAECRLTAMKASIKADPMETDGTWRITLASCRPSYRGEPAICEHLRTEAPLDLVDYWAIDPEWTDGKPFGHAVSAIRSRRGDKALETELTVAAQGGIDSVGIFIADRMGHCHILRAALTDRKRRNPRCRT